MTRFSLLLFSSEVNEWMAAWLAGCMAVTLAIKLYGIGQPNKVFDAITQHSFFLHCFWRSFRLLFFLFLVFLPLASGKPFILTLKHFLALTLTKSFVLSFVLCSLCIRRSCRSAGRSVFAERIFLIRLKLS